MALASRARGSACILVRLKNIVSSSSASTPVSLAATARHSRYNSLRSSGGWHGAVASIGLDLRIRDARNLWKTAGPYVHSVTRDTVAGVSSGGGKAGVAVIRISGPQAGGVLRGLLPRKAPFPAPRTAVLTRLHDPLTRELLDRGIVLFFPAPNSFTGEDVVEVHTHGSPAVTKAVMSAICKVEGVRPARPGEFTLRAVQEGKMGMREVEAMADLLAAHTDEQRRLALKQSSGAVDRVVGSWFREVERGLARIEAVIDFGEDDGIADAVAAGVEPLISAVLADMSTHLSAGTRAELVRSGVRVAILGKPNAGKSSLLNYWAAREAAIVSATPGTTRDPVEVSLDLAGHKVVLTDTAGLRETRDPVELEGMARSLAAATSAHLLLLVLDASAEDLASLAEPRALRCMLSALWRQAHGVVPSPSPSAREISAGSATFANSASFAEHGNTPLVVLLNKCDLLEPGTGGSTARVPDQSGALHGLPSHSYKAGTDASQGPVHVEGMSHAEAGGPWRVPGETGRHGACPRQGGAHAEGTSLAEVVRREAFGKGGLALPSGRSTLQLHVLRAQETRADDGEILRRGGTSTGTPESRVYGHEDWRRGATRTGTPDTQADGDGDRRPGATWQSSPGSQRMETGTKSQKPRGSPPLALKDAWRPGRSEWRAWERGTEPQKGRLELGWQSLSRRGRAGDGGRRVRVVRVSCRTGEGLEEATRVLSEEVLLLVASGTDLDGVALVTRVRHRALLEEAMEELKAYLRVPHEAEKAAEHLRAALRALAALSGRSHSTEHLLDVLMTEFCIGK